MASIYDWSTTAATNATADSGINWAEGQAPSTVNNSARQEMGRIAEFLGDIGGSIDAGGTANALTLASNSDIAAYADGMIFAFRATATNTSTATLSVNSVGAEPIEKLIVDDGMSALEGGEIIDDGTYVVRWNADGDGGNGSWQLMNPAPLRVPTNVTPVATTSGTAVELATGIPAWVKRITVMLNGVSTNGTSTIIIQIGDSGGYENTGYVGAVGTAGGGTVESWDSGMRICLAVGAGDTYYGVVTLTLADASSNTWAAAVTIGEGGAQQTHTGGGTKALSATLDRIQLTTAGGSNTFDAGSASVLYE